jgi:hypothetical protein
MAFLSEAQLETALLEQLAGLGYACASDESMGKSREFARYLPFWA